MLGEQVHIIGGGADSVDDSDAYHRLVEQTSATADLVVLGLTLDRLHEKRSEMLLRYPLLQDVLFVYAAEQVRIA